MSVAARLAEGLYERAESRREISPEESLDFERAHRAQSANGRPPRDRAADNRERSAPRFWVPTDGSRNNPITARDVVSPVRATAPLPDWMNDPSLLPKRPPGRP